MPNIYKSDYVRHTRFVKQFETVNVPEHLFIGNSLLDVDDLDVYTNVTDFTLDVPEGTPVFNTATGLQILDGAATLIPNNLGYLTQASRLYLTPERRNQYVTGQSTAARSLSTSDNIQYIRANSFRAIYSYYSPVDSVVGANGLGDNGLEVAVGDSLIVRTTANVRIDIASGVWTQDGPIQGISGIMAPAVQFVRASDLAAGDIVIGVANDIREIDNQQIRDTGIFLKSKSGTPERDTLADNVAMEVLVEMLATPFIAP